MKDAKLRQSVGISCLLPVYWRDNPSHFERALSSIFDQTRHPDQLVIVEDGGLTSDLYSIISHWRMKLPIESLSLPNNVGLGRALNIGLGACEHPLIVRADADDISKPHRFEMLEKFLDSHPDVVIVGSAIEEFQNSPGDLKRFRVPPCSDSSIRRRSKMRNPFNHMSVMFRKQAVLDAGGYLDCPGFEDYDLWLRLLKQCGRAANLPESLVDARVGNGMLERRRGFAYLLAELRFLRSCQKRNLLSTFDIVRTGVLRIPVRLMPKDVLQIIYSKVLRESPKSL